MQGKSLVSGMKAALVLFSVNAIYEKIADVKKEESSMEDDWNFLVDLIGEDFFHKSKLRSGVIVICCVGSKVREISITQPLEMTLENNAKTIVSCEEDSILHFVSLEPYDALCSFNFRCRHSAQNC